jgi:pantetheine-phosphate adenylyltransferase
MTKRKIVFAGSFDPLTLGHKSIIDQCLQIFDEVYVLVSNNNKKSYLFDKKFRTDCIKELYKSDTRVKVVSFDGLVANFCKENKINFLARGLRNSNDLMYEQTMAEYNHHFYKQIKTIFFMSDKQISFISSTGVREIMDQGESVNGLVPMLVEKKIKNYKRKI